MKFLRNLVLILLGAATTALAQTVTVTGVFSSPTGAAFNGRVELELPVQTVYTPGPTTIVPSKVVIPITNGIMRTTRIFGNDVLSPSGTYYQVIFIDSFGRSVSRGNHLITGSAYNLGSAVPTILTTSNISLVNPAIVNGNNAFTGNNTHGGTEAFTGGLTINGISPPQVVYITVSASTNASIGATTMATAGGSGNTYRFNFYVDTTVVGVGCTGNTFVVVNVLFTDPQASSQTTIDSNSWSVAVGGNGVLGQNNTTWSSGTSPLRTPVIRAKASTTVQYSVTYTIGAACTTGPSYQVYPLLEQLN